MNSVKEGGGSLRKRRAGVEAQRYRGIQGCSELEPEGMEGRGCWAGRRQASVERGLCAEDSAQWGAEHEWVHGELGEQPAQPGFVQLTLENEQEELGGWGCVAPH